MSLYPQTQQNPKLAANVVAMLDTAIGSELAESNMLGHVMFRSKPPKLKKIQPAASRTKDFMKKDFTLKEFAPGGNSSSSYYAVTANFVNDFAEQKQEELQDLIDSGWTKQDLAQSGIQQGHAADIVHFEQVRDGFLKGLKPGFDAYLQGDTQLKDQLGSYWEENDLPLNQDWEKIYGEPWGRDEYDEGVAENQGWAATFTNEETGQMAGTPASTGMWAGYQQRENQPIDEDYIDEKWSQKYKSSINCANPKGFSQRAHCAGRKKHESVVREEVAPAFNYAQIKAMPGKERLAYLKANPELSKLYYAEMQKAVDATLNNYSWMTPEEKAQYERLKTLDAGKDIDTKSYKAEKYLKQLFQQKVDAKKAASMLKVHWAPLSDLSKYLEGQVSPKIELSAYLTAGPQDLGKQRWGNGTVGIVIDGHITIAGRGDLGSDQYKKTAGQRGQQKYVSRPGQIDPSFSSIDLGSHHEVLVDNWKIREIVLPADIPQNVDAVIKQYGIPVRRLQA